MRVNNLRVNNFRGIRQVFLPNMSDINVIVGPNAVGKSTLLEAVRLPKVMLAPRINGEGGTALQQLGVLSPHNQMIGSPGVDIAALSNDPLQPLTLKYDLILTDKEVQILESMKSDLALLLLRSDTIQEAGDTPLAFTQYLSTKEGRDSLARKLAYINSSIKPVLASKTVTLELQMSATSRSVAGTDVLAHSIVTLLDRRLPIHRTLFSLFPADRAFPQGEQAIQLGSGDAAAQIQSHMAQPTLKYARLKQTIIQHIMLQPDGRDIIAKEFNLIFDNLLPGKQLAGININELGLLKVLVRDVESSKVFDIDQMSSGEKGLVLTFLFLRLSMEPGGVVLIDEPELHLNAAVQNRILPFIKTHCVAAFEIQAIVCTHSPEIVRDAYDDEKCTLFHLRSGDDITPILRQDHNELFEVFERLGSSTADVLFSRGSIYVEGEHDAQILQAGFPNSVSGFKVTPLGGRGDIEREVPNLVKQDRAGKLKKKTLFILDNDRAPTAVKGSAMVRVHQLNRYCIENYLLDADIIFDLIKSLATTLPVESRGSFPQILEDMALDQTRETALREVYITLSPESPGMRHEDQKNKTLEEAAVTLSDRLNTCKGALQDFIPATWQAELVDKTQARIAVMREEWRPKWKDFCSGKKLIDDLYAKYGISMNKVELRKPLSRKWRRKKLTTGGLSVMCSPQN